MYAQDEDVAMKRNAYAKAILMGIVAGMRSMTAPALVSEHLTRHKSEELADSAFRLMGDNRVAGVLKIAAAGELIADKLPFVPARIEPGPLAGRVASGALCGATLCAAEGERAGVGAIYGGLSALASSYAFYYLRRKLGETKIVPDATLAVCEDATAVSVGLFGLV